MRFPKVIPPEDMNILKNEWTLLGLDITPTRMKNTRIIYVGEKHMSVIVSDNPYSYRWYVSYIAIDEDQPWFRDLKIGVPDEFSGEVE